MWPETITYRYNEVGDQIYDCLCEALEALGWQLVSMVDPFHRGEMYSHTRYWCFTSVDTDVTKMDHYLDAASYLRLLYRHSRSRKHYIEQIVKYLNDLPDNRAPF